MSNAPVNPPIAYSADDARKAASKGLAQGREAFDTLNGVAKGALGSFDASASIVAKGLSEFNAKSREAFQANTAMAFEFLAALSGTRTVSDAVALAPAHASRQFLAAKAQAKDLQALAEKIARESAEPLKDAIGQAFSKRA